MKRGQGFARRVTAGNLKRFAALLATPGNRVARTARYTNGAAADPAVAKAEALFSGSAIEAQQPLKRRPKRGRSGGAGRRGQGTIQVEAAQVLFAEISRAKDRWKQANFNKDLFRKFFHAGAGDRLTLWHIDDSGSVEREPPRSRVSVKSSNHRIELGAARGLAYPESPKRPIVVFLRIAPRNFLYMLLMPPSRNYKAALGVLNTRAAMGARMRQIPIDLATAEQEWPASPLWSARRAR